MLCDQNENISIPRSFDNVEQMAKNIVYSRHGIIIGDPMYFFINGRPVTIASQYIYQVVVQNGNNGMNQIKIKFIAPGQISGKKEHHQQIIYYENATFLKELILETTNASVAEKIKTELVKYKQKGEKIVSKIKQDSVIGLCMDPDNQMPPQVKQFLQVLEAPRTRSNYPSLDTNAIGG